MAKDPKKVDELMADMNAIKADDPDILAKLNKIALKVAEAQGKKTNGQTNNIKVAADPMDELGCEGCQ